MDRRSLVPTSLALLALLVLPPLGLAVEEEGCTPLHRTACLAWHATLDEGTDKPGEIAYDGGLYTYSVDQRCLALSWLGCAESGLRVLARNALNGSFAGERTFRGSMLSPIALDGHALYVAVGSSATSSIDVHALDRNSLSTRWARTFAGIWEVKQILADGDRVIVRLVDMADGPSHRATTFVLDARDGTTVTQLTTPRHSSATSAGGILRVAWWRPDSPEGTPIRIERWADGAWVSEAASEPVELLVGTPDAFVAATNDQEVLVLAMLDSVDAGIAFRYGVATGSWDEALMPAHYDSLVASSAGFLATYVAAEVLTEVAWTSGGIVWRNETFPAPIGAVAALEGSRATTLVVRQDEGGGVTIVSRSLGGEEEWRLAHAFPGEGESIGGLAVSPLDGRIVTFTAKGADTDHGGPTTRGIQPPTL